MKKSAVLLLIFSLSFILFNCKKSASDYSGSENILKSEFGFDIIYNGSTMQPFSESLSEELWSNYVGLKDANMTKYFTVKVAYLYDTMSSIDLKELANYNFQLVNTDNSKSLNQTTIDGEIAYQYSYKAHSNSEITVYFTEKGNQRFMIELFRSPIGIENFRFNEHIQEITISENTETTEKLSNASIYHRDLHEFIYSDSMKAVTTTNFIENNGAAGSLKSEFPGGRIESVSGYTTIEITDDNLFLKYGYSGALFIGKDKREVIRELATDYSEDKNQISFESHSIIFEFDNNEIITKIYIGSLY